MGFIKRFDAFKMKKNVHRHMVCDEIFDKTRDFFKIVDFIDFFYKNFGRYALILRNHVLYGLGPSTFA